MGIVTISDRGILQDPGSFSPGKGSIQKLPQFGRDSAYLARINFNPGHRDGLDGREKTGKNAMKSPRGRPTLPVPLPGARPRPVPWSADHRPQTTENRREPDHHGY